MADLDRIKRNVAKMVSLEAPEVDIDAYLQSEGTTVEQVRAHNIGAPPEMGTLDTAKDVAKSAGIGVVQGGIGLATLPGNVEQLGRMGINKVAELAGADGPVVSDDAFLPTYNDAKTAVEGYTGEFYKPKTTAGEYARTFGEFAPAAIGGPAGWASRAARVAVPAVASETAGQVTEGTALEPWARIAGALAGGRVTNAAGNAAGRTVTPLPTNAERQAAVKLLESEGVTALTAGQKTGRKPLQWTESTLSDIPFAGKKANAMMEAQAEQFTRATLKRAGVSADRATPQVVDKAFTDLGNEFNALTARNNLVPTKYFTNRLNTILSDYKSVTAEPFRAPILDDVVKTLQDPAIRQNGAIPGRLYQSYRSDLGKASKGLKARDPAAANAIRDVIDVLDRTMETSIRAFKGNNPADLGKFRTVRGQYRNLLAIEDAMSGAGVAAAEGIITPSALRNAVKKQGKRAYVRGKGDLAPLARAGSNVMSPLPNSGTTPRAVAAGLIGGLSLTDPTMITSVLAPIIAGRTLMSGPAQRYFANQSVGGASVAIPQADARIRGLLAIPGAVDEEVPLRGGIGPRYQNGILGGP